MTAKTPTVLLMAGGTGGHIFPAQALAEELASRGWHIHWLGTADRMEADLVPKLGWPFHSIVVRGLRGKSSRQLLSAPWMLLNAIRQARQLLKQLQPDLVVGFGGYASGPGGVAAWLQRTPLLIHEQNAVAGTTNRWLARLAAKVLVAFPQAFAGHAKQQLVGNPVRKALIAAKEPGSKSEQTDLHVLVIGGSLGAKALNDGLPEQLATLSETTPLQVKHQTGSAMQAEVQQHYQQLQSASFVGEAQAFIDDMASAYQWADLVICRAGALTVSEVACAGVAAVFVPLPQAIDDHQTANANWLVGQQAALLLPQQQLQQGGLIALLRPLLGDKTQLQQLAARARQCALDNAAQQLADACEQQLGARV
ncbi:undecaprenyldiphospho-muramoylpentapeptide beta-N-acetylglucosaminyltransferase [Alkalimonas amylolytica]|uniref:UDP-N-acetylglucosamine--N-acetylmuramyl-(pentapeptide) pyrophosphoryl-undecaprenol N-acetylglucosamine transferase n=1 Tax=Alkalimonas amylolytica TaxID=152573 RepID=A0A1H4E8X3_ALKAM|nr:undecaprenyldiphospho-muramoylpentapeptide beta-N-acetylglucosaminyltransferase [Alkalimonas amylolytica]SEA81020.1 UDP-N-acetylglucosamine-N-acetylmuramylpentapeptide N-acetylglucosamine transferase [Alkalimonas amylolytica]